MFLLLIFCYSLYCENVVTFWGAMLQPRGSCVCIRSMRGSRGLYGGHEATSFYTMIVNSFQGILYCIYDR